MSAFGRCLCISLTAPLYYQTIVAFLCGVFEQFANRFSGVFKRAPAYRDGGPRVFPDRTAGSFSANVLGGGSQLTGAAGRKFLRRPSAGVGPCCPKGNRAGDGMARFVSEEKASGTPFLCSFTAPRKIPWRCRRCVWHLWRTSPRRSSRHIPGSARHRPP